MHGLARRDCCRREGSVARSAAALLCTMAGAAALVCAAPAARRAAVGGSGGGAVEVAHPASRAAYTGTAKSPGASAAGGFVEGTLDVDGRPIPWRLELPPGVRVRTGLWPAVCPSYSLHVRAAPWWTGQQFCEPCIEEAAVIECRPPRRMQPAPRPPHAPPTPPSTARAPPPGPGPFPLALILTHGSKGDLAGGELPTYAAAAAAASVPCLRFTCGSQSVATRARVMQALMLRGRELHPALAQAARWVVGGRSLGARTAAQLAFDCAAAGAAADSVDSGDANNATAGMARSGSSGSLSSEGGEGSGRDLACSIGAAGLTVAGALLSAYPVHPPNNPVRGLGTAWGTAWGDGGVKRAPARPAAPAAGLAVSTQRQLCSPQQPLPQGRPVPNHPKPPQTDPAHPLPPARPESRAVGHPLRAHSLAARPAARRAGHQGPLLPTRELGTPAGAAGGRGGRGGARGRPLAPY